MLTTPSYLQAVSGDSAVQYGPSDFRLVTAAVVASQGVAQGQDLQVAQRGAGANFSVDVSAGQAFVNGVLSAGQGMYAVTSTATVNVAMPAAPSSGTRVDVLVAHVYDKQVDGGSQYAWALEVVSGSSGVSPPSLPPSGSTWAGYLPLANVLRTAGESSVANAAITDVRQFAVMDGGVQPVLSTALPSTPYMGQVVWTTNTKRLLVWDGTGWEPGLDVQQRVQMRSVDTAVDGGSPPTAAAGQFKMAAGTLTATTNSIGEFTVSFPVPFAGGLLSVVAWNGNMAAANASVGRHGPTNSGGFTFRAIKLDGSGAAFVGNIQIDYFAVGW